MKHYTELKKQEVVSRLIFEVGMLNTGISAIQGRGIFLYHYACVNIFNAEFLE